MKPKIWLRSGEQIWWETATDEKGTLNIDRIAGRMNLLPRTLLFEELAAYEGITIGNVTDGHGPTAGQLKDSAVIVRGTAIPPPGVLFLAVKCYKMFQYGLVDSAVRVVMNIRTCSLEADGFVRFRQDVGFAL